VSARRAEAAALRLRVPELFKGDYSQVLISTFGVDIEFYERVLRRDVARFNHQVVLVDGTQLSRSIAGALKSGYTRQLNRSWLAAPVHSNGAAHAKFLLFAGADSGLLLIGSGNLSISGYAGPGECFAVYRWSREEPDDLSAFAAIRRLTTGLRARDLIDETCNERIDAFWTALPWLTEQVANSQTPVRDNLDLSLGEQLVAEVAREPVDELVVSAPFFDRDCVALARLARELAPKHVRVLLQHKRASVDPKRLERVLAEINGEAYSIAATGDLDAYLHAKIIVARTRTRAVCLTGSANCSVAALWLTPPHGNVEVGNLLSGELGMVDHLFDTAAVTVSGPLAVRELDVAFREDEEVEGEGRLRLIDLRWDPPNLRCQVSAKITRPDDVEVLVGGAVAEASISLVEIDAGTQLVIELSDPTVIESSDGVVGVALRLSSSEGGESLHTDVAIPYHVAQLQAQEHRTVDADRLRRAAQLELDDPDLEKALAALEEILIGDPTAAWRAAKSEGQAGQEDGGGTSIAWDEIDWAAVRRSGRYRGYENLGAVWQVRPSDLALYLEALSRAIRDLADSSAASTQESEPELVSDTDDDEGLGGGFEGAGDDDSEEPSDASDKRERRRQSAVVRNMRLIRNFVRRNLGALESPEFRAGVGPGVVIPNAVILNWICWWAATKSAVRPGELVEERVRLWRVLWGDADSGGGYLDELDAGSQELALSLFDQFRTSPVNLASFIDIWMWLPDDDVAGLRDLRDVVRRASTHYSWQVDADDVVEATNLINARPTTVETYDPSALFDVLWSIACTTINDADLASTLAAAAHVDASAVMFTEEVVRVRPGQEERVKQATFDLDAAMDSAAAQRALAVWMQSEELPYYRLKWGAGSAFYDTDSESGWLHDPATDETRNLQGLDDDLPPWAEVFEALSEGLEGDAAAVA